MIIKASTALRNDYVSISDMARKTKEPIYITRNGEGDGVYMNIDAFEKREQVLAFREKILEAEQERINGESTLSVTEARNKLQERVNEL